MEKNIALIPGDGIGPDVVAALNPIIACRSISDQKHPMTLRK